MKSRLLKLWDSLHASFWFIPSLMAVVTFAVAEGLIHLDSALDFPHQIKVQWLYGGTPEGAREVLGVIAGSMITLAGVVFSITIVALTLAAQQFGPRLLRNFMSDRGNQFVLGTFIATFLFCVLVLRTIRSGTGSFVPPLAVTAGVFLCLVSLGVLIYFIHHAASSLQSSNIVTRVAQELEDDIYRLFPETLGRGGTAREAGKEHDPPADFREGARPLPAGGSGYVAAVDEDSLIQAASHKDVIILLERVPGDFVFQGSSLASVYPGGAVDEDLIRAVNQAVILGPQRTTMQDASFLIDQLVEIALRALSPSLNDPFTAITCLDRLGQAFSLLAGRAIPSPYRYGEGNQLRVIARPLTFAVAADLAFSPIALNARNNPAVIRHLLKTLAAVAPFTYRDEDRQALSSVIDQVEEETRTGPLPRGRQLEMEKEWLAAREALRERRNPEDTYRRNAPGKTAAVE